LNVGRTPTLFRLVLSSDKAALLFAYPTDFVRSLHFKTTIAFVLDPLFLVREILLLLSGYRAKGA
jgi:hypothetical protein